MSFNLTQEPWIPVVSQDFQLREVSLIELFENWENLREIQADNPPTTLALYRLLFAMLHHVYQGPVDEEHWEEIYEDNGQAAIAYLQEKHDQFDLLHSEYPFMQDPSIDEHSASECYSYLAYELHGANTSTVFCHQHHWSGSSLTLAEAARLTIRLQVFDFYGRKTGASKRAGGIPTMNAANVLVLGSCLKDTLLRNLIKYSEEEPIVCEGEDLPCWEKVLLKPKKRSPNGYIDYLTYQWRRIRLLLDQGKVVKVASHPGDTLPDGVQIPDCGFAYRTTKKGTLPITLNVNKSLWRDSAAFFQSRSDGETCPRIINWQINLEENTDLIPKTLKIQVLGLEADQASPVHWVSERFSASIEFLSNRDLWEKLCEAIKVAEDHQKVFYPSYASLAKILEYDKPSSLAKALDGESRYWATLDRAFPFLLDALPQDTRTEADGITRYGYEELPKWTKTVQNAARDAFTASIESIRNYKARAAALRTLEWQLRKLRGEDKDAKGSGKTKKKTAA